MKRLDISTDILRRATTAAVYERGVGYVARGAVLALALRGNELTASVAGSEAVPYLVRVELRDAEIVAAWCDCPYDLGWCKHIVAALLAASAEPGAVQTRPSLDELLSPLDRDQLHALLARLADRDPSLVDAIEREMVVVTATSPTTIAPARIEVDTDAVRRRVHATLHSLSRLRPSEAYWHVGRVVAEVRLELEPVRQLIATGDGRAALALLDAITESYAGSWHVLDDSDGYVGEFIYELGSAWAEALLATDLPAGERAHWADKLDEFAADVSDYGIETAFDVALDAARHGWDETVFLREYDASGLDELDSGVGWSSRQRTIVDACLNVLERQDRREEFLRLSAASGRWHRHALMLARDGRAHEAARVGVTRLRAAHHALELASLLQEQGADREALQVAERGMDLDGSPASVAKLARELAVRLGDDTLAIRAAAITVVSMPSLLDYERLRELSGDAWPDQREAVLARLRGGWSASISGAVDILLHERMIDDAIALVSRGGSYDVLGRVADAAVDARPDWVIDVSVSQAEQIMNAAKASRYDIAAAWLERARGAYLSSGRAGEWQEYVEQLMQLHGRKYRLMPHLRQLAR